MVAIMSLRHCLSPAATSSSAVLKFAGISVAKSCPCSTRHFTSSMTIQLSSKRKLVTTTAYRPDTLDQSPPPPRNISDADTSISAAIPRINDLRPPDIEVQHEVPISLQKQDISLGLPEKEAQKSKLREAPITSSTSEPLGKPKRSKLRPRKAAVNLTPAAILHLKELLEQPDPKLIRVGVKNRGCSGLAYHLDYVERPGPFDEAVEQDGVKVLIDSKALFSIIGSEMDWVEDKLNQRFVFRNPNISKLHSIHITWFILMKLQRSNVAVGSPLWSRRSQSLYLSLLRRMA